jgi:hypothetical protein
MGLAPVTIVINFTRIPTIIATKNPNKALGL